jgi:hypothetical protein
MRACRASNSGVEQVTPEQLAWLAGVIDTMGILRARRVGENDLPGVFLHTPNVRLLERVAEMTGTRVTIVTRSYSKVGCAEHCEDKHLHVSSKSGRWSVTGAKATVLLKNILPYLQLQRAEAEELLRDTEGAPFKRATLAKMAKLGWPIPE